MNKRNFLLVASCLLLPSSTKLFAFGEDGQESEYQFEFKVAKKRVHQDKKERKRSGERGGADTEMWLYKVQVENDSLVDVAELKVIYTIYLSPSETGRGRGAGGPGGAGQEQSKSPRTVSGEAILKGIKRGNRATFETIASAISKGGRQRSHPPRGRGQGGRGGKGQGEPERQGGAGKLDGIKIELYVGGNKVGEHVYGSAAKRIAVSEKESRRKFDRQAREEGEF